MSSAPRRRLSAPGKRARSPRRSVSRVGKRVGKRSTRTVTRRSRSGPARRTRRGALARARSRRERHVAAIPARPDMLEVRASALHGKGVFARRRIRKGTRIIEYLGDRVSHREADRRYETKTTDDGHTFLFIVDRGIVIDGGNNGNDARFINHGCDPNCESAIEDRRVFIEALRTIQPGEELTYDYQIGRDKTDPPNVDEIFACRCGAATCRGSMLWPPRRKPRVSRERRA
ncbi:MAG TPA: SET domain-containing protein-lysine N-methyltransferase [Steroidobacteraceae bacterium]|nr:SET domain-containing protein-lysine N-methyltransferase [Steroidobacteraceae bacterium]